MTKLSNLLSVLSFRSRFLAFMNFCFFGTVFIVALVSAFLLPPQLYTGPPGQFSGLSFSGNFIFSILSIFAFNLIVSAFLIVTLPGFALFPLSAAFLIYRAFIWGLLMSQSPNWLFLVALPTLILEGEGYTLAAVAGTLVGISWVRPEWVYPGEGTLRNVSLRKALRECTGFYVLAASLLLVGAVVETATLASIS